MFKKRKKDTRTYKNFKYWSIEKLDEVINSPNHCGVDGADYDGHIEEMKMVLWDKLNKKYENNIEQYIKEME